MTSFRARILIGSILWTLGLLALSHLLFLLFMHSRRFEIRVRHDVLLYIALALMIAGLVYLRTGVSSIDQLRGRLADVREGRTERMEGKYPAEVQPLVNDLNALIDEREAAVKRALSKAGDLAHGLKTPLAVLAQEGERAASSGHEEIATMIGQQVERMRRQVDYHLSLARASASGATTGVRSSVLDSVDGLVRTLLRLHSERGIRIDVSVPAEHTVRVRREDLDEMLGNLLDNACKWTATRVTIASTMSGPHVVITVDDDGPGLDPAMRAAVLQRGVRADEAAPGSGFGLAIVRDLAELYGGAIALDRAPQGGV
ncbi:MAG: ATP-binding protein, partial [Thermoanaerobaculia bacterium]